MDGDENKMKKEFNEKNIEELKRERKRLDKSFLSYFMLGVILQIGAVAIYSLTLVIGLPMMMFMTGMYFYLNARMKQNDIRLISIMIYMEEKTE